MSVIEKHQCIQCGKTFETWPRAEDLSTIEIKDIQLVNETEFCSIWCLNEWYQENRSEFN